MEAALSAMWIKREWLMQVAGRKLELATIVQGRPLMYMHPQHHPGNPSVRPFEFVKSIWHRK